MKDDDYEWEIRKIEIETKFAKIFSCIVCLVFAFLLIAILFIWA